MGERRRVGFVEPIIVRLPGVRGGNQNEVAGAVVVESEVSQPVAVNDVGNPFFPLKQLRDFCYIFRAAVLQIHMRELMIRRGKRRRVGEVDEFFFSCQLFLRHAGNVMDVRVGNACFRNRFQQSGVAQNPVGICYMVNGNDGILAGEKPNEVFLSVDGGHFVDKFPDQIVVLVQRRHHLRAVRSEFLGFVVGVRQIDVEERRPLRLSKIDGGIDRPCIGNDVGHRPPPVHQRKIAVFVAQHSVKRFRARPAPQRFRPVRIVNRGGRADVVRFAELGM